MRRAIALTTVIAATLFGCKQTEGSNHPDSRETSSPLEEARFVRRLTLDLSGLPPSDADLARAVKEFEAAGAGLDARKALADKLIKAPAFSKVFVSELENRVLAGTSLSDEYQLICGAFRVADPECASCSVDATDQCDCKCKSLEDFAAERTVLMASADDLAKGSITTGEVERRYGGSKVFFYTGGSADAIATALFTSFLGKKISPDETRNASAMVNGSYAQGSPAGLVFHRHGSSYDDLVDIVFTSEVYREAAVAAVFDRYLGRPPTATERGAFVSGLDAKKPDLVPVIVAVVSSAEYFGQ